MAERVLKKYQKTRYFHALLLLAVLVLHRLIFGIESWLVLLLLLPFYLTGLYFVTIYQKNIQNAAPKITILSKTIYLILITAIFFGVFVDLIMVLSKGVDCLWVKLSKPEAYIWKIVNEDIFGPFMMVVLLMPMLEEWLFRKNIYPFLLKTKLPYASIATSIAFSLIHYPDYIIVYGLVFLFSLQANYIYKKTKSYFLCVVFHSGHNLGLLYLWSNGALLEIKDVSYLALWTLLETIFLVSMNIKLSRMPNKLDIIS
jgi:hypothetical protein